MAKKSNTVNKSNDKKADEKVGFFARVKKFFASLAKEIKLVVWPSRKTLKETTVVVIVVVAAVVVLVFAIDKAMTGVLDLMGFNTAPIPTAANTEVAEVEETTAASSEGAEATDSEATTTVTVVETSATAKE